MVGREGGEVYTLIDFVLLENILESLVAVINQRI